MHLKFHFPAAALILLAFVPAVCLAQDSRPATATRPATTTVPARPATSTSTIPDSTILPSDYPPPRISIATPAPAPAPWSLPDRLKWMSEVLLLVVAAVFAWLAVAALRKIERQSQYAEENAQAAADAARAALLIAENLAKAERPWLLVSAAPVPGSTNSFSIVATNRGRSPARVLSLAECIAIVRDETELPRAPIFKTAPRPPVAPTILLPGESVGIKTFSRDEVKTVCENPEEAQRIEEWAEKIYLYGNVVYNDLSASGDNRLETGWCCWYIHGRQKSGMIMAGPPEYNRHT